MFVSDRRPAIRIDTLFLQKGMDLPRTGLVVINEYTEIDPLLVSILMHHVRDCGARCFRTGRALTEKDDETVLNHDYGKKLPTKDLWLLFHIFEAMRKILRLDEKIRIVEAFHR